VVKVRNRIHVSVEADYRKRDLPELLYAILSTVREVGRCRYTYLLNHVETSPSRIYHHLEILERCGYLQVDRMGRRRVYVTITDTGKGFTDDLREYLRVRQMYTIMHRELKEKIQSLYGEGTVIE
jgi:Bacterial regulatory protein, arsR family.